MPEFWSWESSLEQPLLEVEILMLGSMLKMNVDALALEVFATSCVRL